MEGAVRGQILFFKRQLSRRLTGLRQGKDRPGFRRRLLVSFPFLLSLFLQEKLLL